MGLLISKAWIRVGCWNMQVLKFGRSRQTEMAFSHRLKCNSTQTGLSNYSTLIETSWTWSSSFMCYLFRTWAVVLLHNFLSSLALCYIKLFTIPALLSIHTNSLAKKLTVTLYPSVIDHGSPQLLIPCSSNQHLTLYYSCLFLLCHPFSQTDYLIYLMFPLTFLPCEY